MGPQCGPKPPPSPTRAGLAPLGCSNITCSTQLANLSIVASPTGLLSTRHHSLLCAPSDMLPKSIAQALAPNSQFCFPMHVCDNIQQLLILVTERVQLNHGRLQSAQTTREIGQSSLLLWLALGRVLVSDHTCSATIAHL